MHGHYIDMKRRQIIWTASPPSAVNWNIIHVRYIVSMLQELTCIRMLSLEVAPTTLAAYTLLIYSFKFRSAFLHYFGSRYTPQSVVSAVLELLPTLVTLTFDHDLGSQGELARQISGQRSFSSKVNVWTHTNAYTHRTVCSTWTHFLCLQTNKTLV